MKKGDRQAEKLIIENRTDKSMAEVLSYVKSVLDMGRISGNNNEQYCYHCGFEGDNVYVSAFRNAQSDRLVVSTHNNAILPRRNLNREQLENFVEHVRKNLR